MQKLLQHLGIWLQALWALYAPIPVVPDEKGLLAWTGILKGHSGWDYGLELYRQRNGRYRLVLTNKTTQRSDCTYHYRLHTAIRAAMRLCDQFQRAQALSARQGDELNNEYQQPLGAVAASGGATWTQSHSTPRTTRGWRATRQLSQGAARQPAWLKQFERRLRRQ